MAEPPSCYYCVNTPGDCPYHDETGLFKEPKREPEQELKPDHPTIVPEMEIRQTVIRHACVLPCKHLYTFDEEYYVGKSFRKDVVCEVCGMGFVITSSKAELSARSKKHTNKRGDIHE